MKKLLATVLLVAFCASFTVADATLRMDVAKAMADTPSFSASNGATDMLQRFSSADGPDVVLAAHRPSKPRPDYHRPPPPPRPPRRKPSKNNGSDVEKVVIGLIIGAMIAGAAASGSSGQ